MESRFAEELEEDPNGGSREGHTWGYVGQSHTYTYTNAYSCSYTYAYASITISMYLMVAIKTYLVRLENSEIMI